MTASTEAVIRVDFDGWTSRYQLSVGDAGGGYRIAGPKYNGSGHTVLSAVLTQRDADQIRYYLDRAFPPALGVS